MGALQFKFLDAASIQMVSNPSICRRLGSAWKRLVKKRLLPAQSSPLRIVRHTLASVLIVVEGQRAAYSDAIRKATALFVNGSFSLM